MASSLPSQLRHPAMGVSSPEKQRRITSTNGSFVVYGPHLPNGSGTLVQLSRRRSSAAA